MSTSKLAAAVNTATGKNFTDDQLFSNALRSMDSANNIPAYHAGDNFVPYGVEFTKNPQLLTDYMNTIAVKYALVFIKNVLANNPLYRFRRGELGAGGKLESVVFDTIQPKIYKVGDGTGSTNPYKVNFGRVLGNTYVQTFDVVSSNTIVDTQDQMYFQNLAQFNDFVFGKITQVVNGIVLDEYTMTKTTLVKSLVDGMINKDTANNIKDLQKKILYWARMFQYFNSNNNALGVNSATRVEDVEVIIPLKHSINLDVDYVSNVFNAELMKNTNFHMTEIDSFPTIWTYTQDHVVTTDDYDKGFLSPDDHPLGSTVAKGSLANPQATDAEIAIDGDKIGALVLDRDALQIWDALPLTLSAVGNPANRTTNIFGNQKSYMMFVQALNSHAIMYDDTLED